MSNSNLLPIVLIGGGGHAAVLADILLSQKRTILAVVSPAEINNRMIFSGLERLDSDDQISQFTPDRVKLVNGIGMMPRSKTKQYVNDAYLSLGYEFETVISDDSLVSPYAEVEQGAQIFAGAIVQAGAVIGAHSTINTGAVIEHDCCIGRYNHIAPRATLCGQVHTESGVYVGAGATVIQNLSLNEGSIVAAGAIVVDSLEQQQIIYPAKTITKTLNL